MRSWISCSFKNALVRRLVCDGALSSCHHQFDVSVPRRAVQCGNPNVAFGVDAHTSSMKHGGKTMPCTIAAPTMVPGFRWLCTSMHTPGSRSAFRAGLPWEPTTHIGLFCAGPCSSGRTSRQRTPRASGPRASNAVCHGPRARPRAAARHGKISTLPSGSPLSISAHGRA